MATGEVCWLEINTGDVAGATSFYTQLFGWQKGTGEVGFPYQFLKRPGEERNFGGVMGRANVPPHWLVYFNVPDLEAALQRVAELGGKVLSPVVTLSQGGRFAAVADPQGAALALFQAS
jgi:uncharacterized protein